VFEFDVCPHLLFCEAACVLVDLFSCDDRGHVDVTRGDVELGNWG
jgi:hypothetical protein